MLLRKHGYVRYITKTKIKIITKYISPYFFEFQESGDFLVCGIIGYAGKKRAIPVIIEGLETLEYRGYDSAGLAYLNQQNELKIIKEKGKIAELKKILKLKEISDLGIGHTRWATHGEPSKTNSHPHHVGSITLVHNGIIENYEELKKHDLLKECKFKSSTDTEVACALINGLYNKKKDILKSLEEAEKLLVGSYALAIILENDLDHIYIMKKDSPLIVGIGNKENFVASDVPAIIKYTKHYILLNDHDIGIISKDDFKIYNKGKLVKKEILEFEWDLEASMKNGYEHFMLKEIFEQPEVVKKTISAYIKDNDLVNLPDLTRYKRIDIVGCGSAFHTGLVAKYLFEEYANTEINVAIASEYRYTKNFLDKDGLLIVISQSGETADTLASLRLVKEKNVDTLAIVNVVGSSIAREAKEVLYIKAGPEIAVATTKAYTAQVLLLSLLAFKTSVDKKLISLEEKTKIIKEYNSLNKKISKILQDIEVCQKIAKKIYNHNNIFFLGRKIDYAITMEGSLKLKEISYLHSESYPSGELKHGTIALINKDTPVISVITDESIALKTISNIKETKARDSYSIVISSVDMKHNRECYDELIIIPKVHALTQPILPIIYLQLIAYYVAKNNNCDIDKPKNLAKSVTVE